MTLKKVIGRLFVMDLELILGLGLFGICLYGLISQNMYLSLENISYGEFKYTIFQMINGIMFFGALILVVVGLSITCDALQRMHIVVEYGIRD